ncbi:MAG: FG-GAP repeat domain-containing protein [Verrucomicrobiales bacterium]
MSHASRHHVPCTAACLLAAFGFASFGSAQEKPAAWKKHVIMQQGHCNTAVAIDSNGDKALDVIASFNRRVSLFLAPDWREIVIHRFLGAGDGEGAIHSEVIDADGDGDVDWAGTLSHASPIWLENPGHEHLANGVWIPRIIDPDLVGIHCIARADIDNDGRDDLIINNFEPEKGLGDSMVWLSIPGQPLTAERWDRHIFANKDARGGSHYMGVGDIDGDGWKEIAVGAKGGPFADGNWFAFWKNPGKDGVKGPWKKILLAENQEAATNILPCDVNGDGKVDWLASRGHSRGVLWFENPGWKIHEIDTEIRQPHSLTVFDHDGDGDTDAASCGYESRWVRWYENDGKGNFTIHTLDDNQESYDLRTVDMDGDGDPDLLNAGRGSGNVVWYENLGRPTR